MGEVEVEELSARDEEAWDDFLMEADDATFWHQIGWKRVIEKTFGHRPYYLLAKENGNIKGILPLFFIKTPFFGNFLVSIPFTEYGGVVSNMDRVVDRVLIEEAIRITREIGADYLELRSLRDYGLDLKMNNDYATFIFPLERADIEEAWQKDLPIRKRKNVKKARREGVEVEIGKGYLLEFFEIFCRKWRELGTPSYGLDLFENIVDEFGDKIEIIVARREGRVIGAYLLVFFKETIGVHWGGSLKRYFNLRPNEAIWWETIRYGYQRGFLYIDDGRSAIGSGTYRFKVKFGERPEPLYYQYYLSRVKEPPKIHPTNPRYRLYIETWKRLPLWLTRRLGPKIIRYIP